MAVEPSNSTPHLADLMDAEHKVDVLAEIVNDLIIEMVNSGRMSATEERTWRAATNAVVLDRPELIEPGGMVVSEAERIAYLASRN